MSQPATIEKCQWVGDNIPGNCDNHATRHVKWAFDSGYQRNAHFCEAHANELRERKSDAQDTPTAHCNASCQIINSAL